MAKFYLENVKNHLSQTVTVSGWLFNKRGSGKIIFLHVRDGTGFVQVVIEKEKVSEDLFKTADSLKREACIEVTGKIYEEPRAPHGLEMLAENIKVISNPEEDYPIGKKEHGPDFLLGFRHLWLRAPKQQAIMRIRDELCFAFREFFHQKNFCLIDTPILTGSVGEEAGELFELEYFDHGKAYLSQTGQLYLEAAALALGKVYCLGPTFRAEKSKTRRHLTEFWMLEAEVAFNTYIQNMDLQEEMLKFSIEKILKNRQKELKILERDVSRLQTVVEKPFIRITYDEALERLKKLGNNVPWGKNLGAEDETLLTSSLDVPMFVTHYPAQVKAFYMEPEPTNPKTVQCSDLLAPEGYGEIIGGSARIGDYHHLIEKLLAQGLDPKAYEWYIDLRKWGGVPHAGFGIGIERTVSYICGLQHLREAAAFPRMITRIYP